MKDLSKVFKASKECSFEEAFRVSDGRQEVFCNIAGLMAFVRQPKPRVNDGKPFTNLEYIGKDITLYQKALQQMSQYEIRSGREVVDLLGVARAISHSTWAMLFVDLTLKVILDIEGIEKIKITTIERYELSSILEHCSVKMSGSDFVEVSERVPKENDETERVKWFCVDWENKNNRLLFFDKIYNWKRDKAYYLNSGVEGYFEETLFKMLFVRG